MKKAVFALIALAIAASAVALKGVPETKVASIDPDYCSGIACTEETDTCCDESVGSQ